VVSIYRKIITALIFSLLLLVFISGCTEQQKSSTKIGNVTIVWLGHSSFRIEASKIIYIDPFVLDEEAPKADYIVITHDHPDHCDSAKVDMIQKQDTRIFGTLSCILKLKGKINSLNYTEYFYYNDSFRIDAVPAYNTESLNHPYGFGFGAILRIDGMKIYVSGDTDAIPEMYDLSNESIDVAIIAAGGKYTADMTGAAEIAKRVGAKYVIPGHYNSEKYGIKDVDANPDDLVKALEGSGITPVILKQAV
jgi:L-ascorbate metabolism protein UlaG (beta-lactamase superfamily)